MTIYIKQLEGELGTIRRISHTGGAIGYFGQELLRFRSMAGTLLQIDGFKLDETSSVDERYLTHVLSRSLLEPFFVILYLFDDASQTVSRYEELKDTFKDQYRKLMNDLSGPNWQPFMAAYGSKLEPADSSWNLTKQLPDVKSMLGKLTASYGGVGSLYPIYRIASFDTHGRSLENIFEAVFLKPCNFPVLKINTALELMAKDYLGVLNTLRNRSAI